MTAMNEEQSIALFEYYTIQDSEFLIQELMAYARDLDEIGRQELFKLYGLEVK